MEALVFLALIGGGILLLALRPSARERALERERAETSALFEDLKRVYFKVDPAGFRDKLYARCLVEVVLEQGYKLPDNLVDPYCDQIAEIIPKMFPPMGEYNFTDFTEAHQHIELRKELRKLHEIYKDGDDARQAALDTFVWALYCVASNLPHLSLLHSDEEGLSFPSDLVELLGQPNLVIQSLLLCAAYEKAQDYSCFAWFRELAYQNIARASGLDIDNLGKADRRRLVYPVDSRDPPRKLLQTFLNGSPFKATLEAKVRLAVPDGSRFEHHHIVAGSGHGKTQTLQYLIANDLDRVVKGEASIVVIDSQGDLIRNIQQLEIIDPDRLVLIDPTDVEFPVCLNLFDVQMARIDSYSRLHREQMINGILELYDFVLGSLLGAEMTQKQSVIFRYVTRLMLQIPDATIHTMLALFQDGGAVTYQPYIEKLDSTAREFFKNEFSSKEFTQTKRQVVRRLYGILENQAFNRMFSHPRSKLDLFSEMNAGKIILINTAKDLLKEQGTEIFGRFFIAMIAQAAQERATIPADRRMPTYVYVDEAQEYFDDNIGIILSQARKFKIGMIMAHQYLDQLSPKLQSAFMSNTAIKFAGGVSMKDARVFAAEMRVEPDFITSRPRGSFAASIRGLTKQAIALSVSFGHMEDMTKRDKASMACMRDLMRTRYAVPIGNMDAPKELGGAPEDAPERARPTNRPALPKRSAPTPASTPSPDQPDTSLSEEL